MCIRDSYDDIVDGALVTIERVKTIAADGTVQVAEQIKKSSADTFDGLWKEIQTEADTGVLGTFDDLYTAVKNQDWLSIGKWVASTIYSGLTADQKKQVNYFALGIVTKLNKALGGARDQLVQGAIDLGGQIVNGLTGGFSEVWQQAQGLGSTLVSVFQGLQGPLSTAALAISQGLSGGLLSSFPTIFAGVATMVGTIGAAFEGMLTAISAACYELGLYLFVDGARMAYGLMSEANDLTLQDYAALCDVFYLGGTKCGALFGEAVIINNPDLDQDFRYAVKQHGAMLAKGRLLGLQFLALLNGEDGTGSSPYYTMAAKADRQAMRIRAAFEAKGCAMLFDSPTNQQFPILPNSWYNALSEKYAMTLTAKPDAEHTAVRFCTSWATELSFWPMAT